MAVKNFILNTNTVPMHGVDTIGIGRACIVVPKFQYNLFVGLLDIRMSIELTRKLFTHSEKEWSVLNETIRKTVFELFAKGDFPGLIFTYMCL